MALIDICACLPANTCSDSMQYTKSFVSRISSCVGNAWILTKFKRWLHFIFRSLPPQDEQAVGCPVIVRPGPTGSVIEGFSGFRGNVAIIVDRGACQAQPPGGFKYVTNRQRIYIYLRAIIVAINN